MAKLESSIKNMILSLTSISLVMSAALGFVYMKTKDPIRLANEKKVKDAIAMVVPPFDNDPSKEMYSVDGLELYPAKKDGKLVGTAVKTFSDKGFSGNIVLMVGISPENNIKVITVLEQKETPGLGTKMLEPGFRNQFVGKNPKESKISVKKDGGDIDAITASTITSRAFCDAVNKAFAAYEKGGIK